MSLPQPGCCPVCNHRPKVFRAQGWFWIECEQFRGDKTFAHHVAVTAKTLPKALETWGKISPPRVTDAEKSEVHVKSFVVNPTDPIE